MKTFSPMRPRKSNVKMFYKLPKLICLFTMAEESTIIVEFRRTDLKTGAAKILNDLSLQIHRGETLIRQ